MQTHRPNRGKLKTHVRPGRRGAYYDDGVPTTVAGWAWLTAQAAIGLAGVYIVIVLLLSLPI
jgi:hypothetical protein